MNRKQIWGWWFFDWASQPYATLLTTFIFAPYFAEIARAHAIMQGGDAVSAGAQAQSLWGYGAAFGGAIIALGAPVLGAIADQTGRRLPWVWGFSLLYVLGAAGLWFVAPSGFPLVWAVGLYALGLIGAEFATIFTNALLPGLVPREKTGSVSGSGFGFGYAGGVVSLVLMLALFAENATTGQTFLGGTPALGLDPAAREGTRFVGPFTALWFVVFMIPFALWVREPVVPKRRLDLGAAMRDLGGLLASLPRRRSLSAWLLSSMLGRDALNGLYAFGGVYASLVLGWSITQIGVFGVVSALAAAVISWLGGKADERFGPKPVFALAMIVLGAVCALIVGMSRESIFGIPLAQGSALPDQLFLAAGALIGGAGGVLQASGRSLMVRHTSVEKAAEGFGLYALSGKATAFLAPLSIAVATDLTGSQRLGIAPLIVMFLLALVLLRYVNARGETL